MNIYIGTIDYKHGPHIYAGLTPADVDRQLYEYVCECWESEMPDAKDLSDTDPRKRWQHILAHKEERAAKTTTSPRLNSARHRA